MGMARGRKAFKQYSSVQISARIGRFAERRSVQFAPASNMGRPVEAPPAPVLVTTQGGRESGGRQPKNEERGLDVGVQSQGKSNLPAAASPLRLYAVTGALGLRCGGFDVRYCAVRLMDKALSLIAKRCSPA